MEWAEVDEGFCGIESSASLIGLDRQGKVRDAFLAQDVGVGGAGLQGAGVR